jgi:hypothetical protein
MITPLSCRNKDESILADVVFESFEEQYTIMDTIIGEV